MTQMKQTRKRAIKTSAHPAKRTNSTTLSEQITLAEQSIGYLWEYLSQHLHPYPNEDLDWKNIKEIASILHKLIQNYQQLHTLFAQHSQGDNTQRTWSLSEETLRSIEEQLNLL